MKKILIFALIFFAISCSKKYVNQTVPSQNEGKEIVQSDIEKISDQNLQEREITREDTGDNLSKAGEAGSGLTDIFFDYNSYTLRSDARIAADSAAALLKNSRDLSIIIEGHCDERGTNEYNLALGEKRAIAIKNYIAAQGVAPAKIKTFSYGEEKPICTGSDESCWQKNRRGHFTVIIN